MAKKITTVTESTTDDMDEDEKSRLGEVEDVDVVRALAEIDGADEVRWQVYRLSEPNRGYVTELSTSELSMHRIAELGAGRYRVRGIKPDGRFFKSSTLAVAKPPENQSQSLIHLLEKNRGMDQMQLMTLLMNQQQAQQQNMTQVLIAALGKEQKTEIPWGPILSALPPSLVALKEFFANKTDPMKQMMDAITLTEKLRDGGDKPGGSTWPDIIKEGLSAIPATLNSLKPTPAQSPVQAAPSIPSAGVDVRAIPPLPTAIHTPEAIAPPLDDPMNLQLLPWLRNMIAQLLQAAQRNGNVELYTDLFIDQMPESVTDEQVISLLETDDWWTKLTMFESKLTPYQGWFNELRECILAALLPDGEPNDDNGRTSDARQTQHHDSGEVRESPPSDGAES